MLHIKHVVFPSHRAAIATDKTQLSGLCIPDANSNVHLSAYADDVVIFVSNQKDIESLLKLLFFTN